MLIPTNAAEARVCTMRFIKYGVPALWAVLALMASFLHAACESDSAKYDTAVKEGCNLPAPVHSMMSTCSKAIDISKCAQSIVESAKQAGKEARDKTLEFDLGVYFGAGTVSVFILIQLLYWQPVKNALAMVFCCNCNDSGAETRPLITPQSTLAGYGATPSNFSSPLHGRPTGRRGSAGGFSP